MSGFCLKWYGDHRELNVLTHSFPTRRSADLARDQEEDAGYHPPTSVRAEPVEAFFFSLEESRLLGGASPRGRDITFFSAFSNSPRSRSEEHTSELHSLMRISYAVF